jgi:hypothetical protein
MSSALEHRHAASAQALRDDRAAGVVALPPCVAVAAALVGDPAGIAVERMGERDRIDGAQQIWKPAQVLRGPADRLLHFGDRAQTRQQPDAVLLLLGSLQLALLLLGEQVLPLVGIVALSSLCRATARRELLMS